MNCLFVLCPQQYQRKFGIWNTGACICLGLRWMPLFDSSSASKVHEDLVVQVAGLCRRCLLCAFYIE